MDIATASGDRVFCVVMVDESGQPIEIFGQNRELVVTDYLCANAFAGADVGDTITSTRIINLDSDPPETIYVVWRNESTQQDLPLAPNPDDITLVGTNALTDAQLRASPVNVSVSNFQSNLATVESVDAVSANQISGLQKTQIVSSSGNIADVDASGNLYFDLQSVNTKSINLGQNTADGSLPVVIASNQSAINTNSVVSGVVSVSSVSSPVNVLSSASSQADGHSLTIGSTTDAEAASGNGTLVSLLKRVRTLLGGGLPNSLTASGNFRVSLSEAVTSIISDVSDRAARLVGIVFGSQNQAIKQTPVNFNSAVELYAGANAYDARQIRALTNSDTVSVSGTVQTLSFAGSAATDATISYSTTSVTARVANSARTGLKIQNNANVPAHISFGQTATLNHYVLNPGERYEMFPREFSGAVNIIWASGGSGSAIVTEIV